MRVDVHILPVEVGLWYTNDLNPSSVRVIDTSTEYNMLSCSFNIVNCKDCPIELIWSSCVRAFSGWVQTINVSSTYLSHNNGFNEVDYDGIFSELEQSTLTNLKKEGFGSMYCAGSWVKHETPEGTYRPKLCQYSSKDETIVWILSSSSSYRAGSTDIPDPLSPLLPIVHRPRQVFRTTSCILTQLLNVRSCWSSCFCAAVCGDP